MLLGMILMTTDKHRNIPKKKEAMLSPSLYYTLNSPLYDLP